MGLDTPDYEWRIALQQLLLVRREQSTPKKQTNIIWLRYEMALGKQARDKG